MVKRSYSPSVEFNVKNDIVIIEHNGKQYSWETTREAKQTFLNDNTFDYEITHSHNGEAFISIENLRTNEYVVHQRINLIK